MKVDGPIPFGTPGYFYEAARWRDDRWWVSDMWAFTVRSFSSKGEGREELRMPGDERPSGLGWLPDGSLLVVAMTRRAVMRLRPGSTTLEMHADLEPLTRHLQGFCNDMIVGCNGQAYVGFDPDYDTYGMVNDLGMILTIEPDGSARVAATGLSFPNGMVIERGERLIVAETTGERISSFMIGFDGGLTPESTWADLAQVKDVRPDGATPLPNRPLRPDGIDIDCQGNLWVSDYLGCAVRIARGGAVSDAVFLPDGLAPWACGLGGPDGKALLLCGSDFDFKTRRDAMKSRLFIAAVEIPAALH